ncbi:hypothetical protein EBN03_02670 [Nocardia stercoris]|uniref:Serine hydrolase n=1 Tax=Nocardia stercoris TaxID=2483361 RepID=A0A3M2LCU2_9NOCA|nr:hypothetical protein EBN03_02670 [Nocardia stercoris]
MLVGMIMLPKALADNHAPHDPGSAEAPAGPAPAGGPLQSLEHAVAGAVAPQPFSNDDSIAAGQLPGAAHDVAVDPALPAPTTTVTVPTSTTAPTDSATPTTTDTALPTTTTEAAPPAETTAPATTSAPATSAQPAPTGIAQQMADAVNAVSPGSDIGIEVVDTQTGTVLAALNTDKQFYTASVVKLMIALDDLQSRDWQPDPDREALIRRMLEASDDDIANQLWDTNGGTAIVDRTVALVGLTGTQAPDDQYEWGETRTTPADVVTLYQYIESKIPSRDRALILGSLRGTNEIAGDGTNQFFGIPSGLTGHSWAIKQGWMTLDDSTTLDTTGLVGVDPEYPLRYAVVLLTQQPAETSWVTGGAALTAGVAVLHGLLR